jgi:hypothetical protein
MIYEEKFIYRISQHRDNRQPKKNKYEVYTCKMRDGNGSASASIIVSFSMLQHAILCTTASTLKLIPTYSLRIIHKSKLITTGSNLNVLSPGAMLSRSIALLIGALPQWLRRRYLFLRSKLCKLKYKKL